MISRSSAQDPTPATTSPADETTIRMTFGDTLTARLADNATASDLLGQLPLTLTFRDFNQVEGFAVTIEVAD